MSLTPRDWIDVTANSYQDIDDEFDGQTYDDMSTEYDTYFELLDPVVTDSMSTHDTQNFDAEDIDGDTVTLLDNHNFDPEDTETLTLIDGHNDQFEDDEDLNVLINHNLNPEDIEPILLNDGHNANFEDTETLSFEDVASPFIDEFTVEFNGSITAPGFIVRLRGLQEATTEFSMMEVWRRDVTGRHPDRRVRGLAQILVQDNDMTVTDYEAPLNVTLEYYLRLFHEEGVFDFGPVHPEPQPFIPTFRNAYGGGTAYLKLVDVPELSAPIMVDEFASWTRAGRVLGKYEVLGRRNPIVLTDVTGGREGTISGHCIRRMGQSSRAIEQIIDSGATLLIQNHNPTVSAYEDMYVKIENSSFVRHTKMVPYGELDNTGREEVIVSFELNYIQVDRPDPVGERIPILTWGIVNDTHNNWQHVLARYDSWHGVLVNPFGPGVDS